MRESQFIDIVESAKRDQFSDKVEYAGVFPRLIAAFLDLFFISAIGAMFALPVCASIAFGIFSQNFFATIFGGLLAISFYVFAGFLPILYYSIFESSKWQATPAKYLLKLQVCTIDGQRFGFWGALVRYVLQWILYFAVLIATTILLGAILLLLRIDLAEANLFIQGFFVLSAWVPIIVLLFVPTCANGKQAASDKLLKRLVMKRNSLN
jgi:uncharacterized RDD family membrane protein YckC